MPDLNQLKTYTAYTDSELVKVPGADNSVHGYQYDQQQRSFYIREASLIFSGKHGTSHISTDPVPLATCTTPGLMSSDDKCRLDTLVGTRIGVLGFTGAGFPDDGGYITGDVILAAGSETISIERVGNVVRFVVDVPAVFSCGNEDCLQIFWVQDETDISAIRPPINGGKLSGVNSYGELKVYLFPDSTVVNPANPTTTLNRKAFYPSLIFKRYDDGSGTNEGEFDMVLKRNQSGTTVVGWAFTPGATGTPECVFFLGNDDDNSRISFKLDGNSTPGMLGAVLYNGHVITKRAAVITGYDPTVVQTNNYRCKWWNIHEKKTVGDEFTITNQTQWDLTSDVLVLDSAQDTLLQPGQIVDTWSFKVGEANGIPIYVHYCREQPPINPGSLWTTIGAIQFGDSLETATSGSATVSDVRTIERNAWGVDGLNPLVKFNGGTPIVITTAFDVAIDQTLPGLIVDDSVGTGEQQRPVTIWNRTTLRDAYIEVHMARPSAVAPVYPPVDVLLRAPIDAYETNYGIVQTTGTLSGGSYAGKKYVKVSTTNSAMQIPSHGSVRIISGGVYGTTYVYTQVLVNESNPEYPVLVLTSGSVPPNNAVMEFMHEEYRSPTLRLQFTHNTSGHDILLQPQVGILDLAAVYGSGTSVDDLAGLLEPGYVVGLQHWQTGSTLSGITGITSYPEGFVVYTGTGDGSDEVFNVLKILVIDAKIWIWWNDLLMAPSTADSALLPVPVDVSDPFYTITDIVRYGKFGLRLWPGAKIRRFVVRSRPTKFSEFSLGQLEVS